MDDPILHYWFGWALGFLTGTFVIAGIYSLADRRKK